MQDQQRTKRLTTFMLDRAFRFVIVPSVCVAWHWNGGLANEFLLTEEILQLKKYKFQCFSALAAFFFLFVLITKVNHRCFCYFTGRHLLESLRGSVCIQSSDKFGINITLKRKTAQSYILVKVFIHQSPIISNFLDLIYWLVAIFIFDGVNSRTLATLV